MIDLYDEEPDKFFERIRENGSYGIYIGTPSIGLTPLQWLAYLVKGLDQVLPEQVKAFDEICEELVQCVTGPRFSLRTR